MKNMEKKFFLFLAFLGIFLLGPSDTFGSDYILYVRARGSFGDELRSYWSDVKDDSDIRHSAITSYPPHCSLTGFFPKEKSKDFYINSVKEAIRSLGNSSKKIIINGLIQGSQTAKLDYIKLSSPYLFAVTQAFVSNASVPKSYLKDPQLFPYHITLRDHVFQQNVTKKMKKIHSLERKIDLQAHASWSLFLYEKDASGDLTVIEEFSL